MQSRISAGILAGLMAGLVFGMMMQMMTATTPEGNEMPMMAMVAKVVQSDSLIVGWLYHLFNSALIGGLFAALFGNRVNSYASAIGYGVAYGLGWWILGALILMPLLLGMPAFAPLLMAPMRPVAMGSLIGHLIYGVILGAAFLLLSVRHFGSRAPVSHGR